MQNHLERTAKKGGVRLEAVEKADNSFTYCNSIDIRLVARESLLAHSFSDVPKLELNTHL